MTETFQGSVLWRRHGVVLMFAFVMATALVIAAAHTARGDLFLGFTALSLAPALAGLVLPRAGAEQLAAGAAITLLWQMVIATMMFGEGAHPNALLLATLAVIATYGARSTLFATGVIVGLGQVILAIIGTERLEAPMMEQAQGWESLTVGIGAALLGAWALFTIWRDQRRAEAAAHINDQIADAYREVVPLMSIRLDREGKVIDANRNTALILDRELEDVIGRNWFELALAPEYREQAARYYEQGFRSEVDLFSAIAEYTNEVVGADGARRLITWKAAYIDDHEGRRDSMLCVGQDITDARAAKAEAARARAEIDAFRRLAQKIASLDDARRAVAEGTLELCGAWAVGISEPDRQRERIIVEVCTEPRAEGTTIELARESSNIGQAFLSGRTIVVDDIEADGSSHAGLVEILGSAAVVHQPIVGANGVLGVLSVAWKAPRATIATTPWSSCACSPTRRPWRCAAASRSPRSSAPR